MRGGVGSTTSRDWYTKGSDLVFRSSLTLHTSPVSEGDGHRAISLLNQESS